MEFSAEELDRLTAFQRRFLSISLDRDNVGGLLSEIGTLVGADAGFAAWLDDGAPWMVGWRVGPQIEAYFGETFAGIDRIGNIRCHDPDLDALNRRRRGLGTGVYHENALAPRDRIINTAYHRQAFEPAGMPCVIGMTARLSVGEAVFAFGFQAPEAKGFTTGETEARLRLLLPSFEAGFQAIDRRNRHRERLEDALRATPLPTQIHGPDDPPDPTALLQLPLPELATPEPAESDWCVPHLHIGQIGADRLASAIADRHALTARQNEVVVLLVHGLSTRAIADRLGVTYNTARRHCEAILQKTGVNRRDQLGALGMKCLVGTGSPPSRRI